MKDQKSLIRKADEELQIVWGEVYRPNVPDAQGHYATAQTIREMAYSFMAKGDLKKIDLEHDNVLTGAYIVESFIARSDDPVFSEGSWVVGVHVPSKELWTSIKNGDVNGFSMEAWGKLVSQNVEMTLPDQLSGMTEAAADGHTHQFMVSYDAEGNFLGGTTLPDGEDGHFHLIQKGTRTEATAGHTHRFSYLEGVMNLEVVD